MIESEEHPNQKILFAHQCNLLVIMMRVQLRIFDDVLYIDDYVVCSKNVIVGSDYNYK